MLYQRMILKVKDGDSSASFHMGTVRQVDGASPVASDSHGQQAMLRARDRSQMPDQRGEAFPETPEAQKATRMARTRSPAQSPERTNATRTNRLALLPDTSIRPHSNMQCHWRTQKE